MAAQERMAQRLGSIPRSYTFKIKYSNLRLIRRRKNCRRKNMNRNELKELLGEGAGDDVVTALLDKFHAEQNELKSKVSSLTDENSSLKTEKADLIGYKSKYEEAEKAKLSDAEKIELERKEMAEMKRQLVRQTNANEAKSILTETGLSADDVNALVESIVKESKDDTIKAAQLLANQFKAVKENTAKTTREELATVDVKPNLSNVPSGSEKMDWEKFSKMSQKEQAEYMANNKEEFLNL
jgi:hypothetical protein